MPRKGWLTAQRGRAGCFGVAGGCWGAGPLADHAPHDCWVNEHEASEGGGGAVVGGAAHAAEGAGRRGRGDPLLQQAYNFTKM